MSIEHQVTITCDQCGSWVQDDRSNRLEADLRSSGWRLSRRWAKDRDGVKHYVRYDRCCDCVSPVPSSPAPPETAGAT